MRMRPSMGRIFYAPIYEDAYLQALSWYAFTALYAAILFPFSFIVIRVVVGYAPLRQCFKYCFRNNIFQTPLQAFFFFCIIKPKRSDVSPHNNTLDYYCED